MEDRRSIRHPRSPILHSRPASEKRPMKKKLRVAILFGGKSAEHEISVISARNIVEAMDKRKYEIVSIGIDKQGCWFFDEGARLLHSRNRAQVEFQRRRNSTAVLPGAP